MSVKRISHYEICNKDEKCVLFVGLDGGCISLTPEAGESIIITLEVAKDLAEVLYEICEEDT
jgi:hypothetical protein